MPGLLLPCPGEVVRTIWTEGHYQDLQRDVLGNINGQPPKLSLREGSFDREYAGDIVGLQIMRDEKELFELREVIPVGAGDKR